jgi:hypothetical protein
LQRRRRVAAMAQAFVVRAGQKMSYSRSGAPTFSTTQVLVAIRPPLGVGRLLGGLSYQGTLAVGANPARVPGARVIS